MIGKIFQNRLVAIGAFCIIIFLILFLHGTSFGYESDSDVVIRVTLAELINKENKPLNIKSVSIKNNFATPRKIILPYTRVCMKDTERIKQELLLNSFYEIKKTTLFSKNESVHGTPGSAIWIEPYSELQIEYFMKGDWYDYIFQYVDYDELTLMTTDQIPRDNSCNTSGATDLVERISIKKDDCIGCVTAVDGPDLSVIDFITNDTVLWEKGFISFVPIIKNIGDKPSGKLRVAYYLDGRHTKSFELDNLDSGEVVNTFIAKSGFGGNFEDRTERTMKLKIEVSVLESIDRNINNNSYMWDFTYTRSPLPKHSCSFTDNNSGPDDFKNATSIQYNEKKFSDVCLDDENLLEYTCDQHPAYEGDDAIDVFLYKCPLGCNAGACKSLF